MRSADCATCGRYYIDEPAIAVPASLPDETRFNLISVVRAASYDGWPLELRAENLHQLAAAAPRWRSLVDGIDVCCSFLRARRALSVAGTVQQGQRLPAHLCTG